MPIQYWTQAVVAAAALLPCALAAQDGSKIKGELGPHDNADELAVAPEPVAAEKPPLSLTRVIGVNGVAMRLDMVGFVGAQVAGDGPGDARFTGRSDVFVDLSSKGLGLWDGTILRTHTELRASDTGAGRFGGALWPQNTAALLPLTGEGVEVTSIYVVQNLGAKTNLLVGKINAIDLLASDPFFGGWGTRRFQNIAFVAPPSGVVPETHVRSVHGMGLKQRQRKRRTIRQPDGHPVGQSRRRRRYLVGGRARWVPDRGHPLRFQHPDELQHSGRCARRQGVLRVWIWRKCCGACRQWRDAACVGL